MSKSHAQLLARGLQALALREYGAEPSYQHCLTLAREHIAERRREGLYEKPVDELYLLLKPKLRPKSRPEKKDKAT